VDQTLLAHEYEIVRNSKRFGCKQADLGYGFDRFRISQPEARRPIIQKFLYHLDIDSPVSMPFFGLENPNPTKLRKPISKVSLHSKMTPST
jgi:hypothetical protein